jgi:dolichyl-phosphate beta-glucosyltransferase
LTSNDTWPRSELPAADSQSTRCAPRRLLPSHGRHRVVGLRSRTWSFRLIRDLTIVVPAYNESRRIGSTLEKLLAFGAAFPGGIGRFERYEIVVVDDGSSDGTAELVENQFGGRVRVIRRSQRGGKGAAVRTGVLATTTPWLMFVDADLSIPITELARLEPFAEKTPIVIGSKRAPGNDIDYPAGRRLFGGIGQWIIALFVVRGFHDTQCGFKLFRTDVAQQLFRAQKIDGFGFDFEVLFLARRLGIAVSEVPVRCEHQIGGSVRLKSYIEVLREVATVVWNRLRGAYP